MIYWVYENVVHKMARIHTANCSFCASGRGIHGGGKTRSGKWLGPFDNFESAWLAARETKHIDVRGCSICVGNLVHAVESKPHASVPASIDQQHLFNARDSQYKLNCSLSLQWHPKAQLLIDSNARVTFPKVEAIAGLYRFSAHYPDGRYANYIGESENLRRRFGNYRNPGPTQPTNLRINAWLKNLLNEGGEVFVATAEQAWLDGELADLSRKATRRMFEQMAIALEHADDVESLNR
jgi:hypothetical protein